MLNNVKGKICQSFIDKKLYFILDDPTETYKLAEEYDLVSYNFNGFENAFLLSDLVGVIPIEEN